MMRYYRMGIVGQGPPGRGGDFPYTIVGQEPKKDPFFKLKLAAFALFFLGLFGFLAYAALFGTR